MLENFSARGAKKVRTLVDSDAQKQLEGFFVAMNFKETPIHMLEYPL
jgi:hypothetical protein